MGPNPHPGPETREGCRLNADPLALLLIALAASVAINVTLLHRLRSNERERLEWVHLANQWRASSRFWRTQAGIFRDACRECLDRQRQLLRTFQTATRRP